MNKLNILFPVQGIYCDPLSSDFYLLCIFSFLLVFMDFKLDTERLLYRSNPVLIHCAKCQLLRCTEPHVKKHCCFVCCKSLMQPRFPYSMIHLGMSYLHDSSPQYPLALPLGPQPFPLLTTHCE